MLTVGEGCVRRLEAAAAAPLKSALGGVLVRLVDDDPSGLVCNRAAVVSNSELLVCELSRLLSAAAAAAAAGGCCCSNIFWNSSFCHLIISSFWSCISACWRFISSSVCFWSSSCCLACHASLSRAMFSRSSITCFIMDSSWAFCDRISSSSTFFQYLAALNSSNDSSVVPWYTRCLQYIAFLVGSNGSNSATATSGCSSSFRILRVDSVWNSLDDVRTASGSSSSRWTANDGVELIFSKGMARDFLPNLDLVHFSGFKSFSCSWFLRNGKFSDSILE